MSRWFRVYDDLVDDPKIQRLPGELVKALLNLWCMASQNNGLLPAADDIAFKLRMKPAKVQLILSQLGECGLIDSDETGIHPHNWSSRQFKSDVSNERVKRHRERKCNVTETVTVTPPDTEQRQNRTDGEANASDSVVNFPAYAFEGQTIHLRRDQFDRWCAAYPNIPDMSATLETADAYYTENPPADGKWFFPVSRWLEKENAKAKSSKRRAGYGDDWF